MAKKKQKKSLLPKRIAGVKVPKSVRKGRFAALLASPHGRKLVAEAVLAIGAVAGAKKAGDSTRIRGLAGYAADRLHDMGDDVGRKGKDVGAAGGALAFALGEAARSFVDALHRGESDLDVGRDRGEATWKADPSADGATKPSKKKTASTSYEAGPL